MQLLLPLYCWMEIHLVLAHPNSSSHAGVPDSVINRTLRKWPAGSMDAMRAVGWMVLIFVLGMHVLYCHGDLNSSSAWWVQADAVCL